MLNSTCGDFHYGTALHIAASNLCLGAVKCLLEHGANPSVRVGAALPSPLHVCPDVYALLLRPCRTTRVWFPPMWFLTRWT